MPPRRTKTSVGKAKVYHQIHSNYLKALKGAGFFDDFSWGFKKGFNTVVDGGLPIIKALSSLPGSDDKGGKTAGEALELLNEYLRQNPEDLVRDDLGYLHGTLGDDRFNPYIDYRGKKYQSIDDYNEARKKYLRSDELYNELYDENEKINEKKYAEQTKKIDELAAKSGIPQSVQGIDLQSYQNRNRLKELMEKQSANPQALKNAEREELKKAGLFNAVAAGPTTLDAPSILNGGRIGKPRMLSPYQKFVKANFHKAGNFSNVAAMWREHKKTSKH